MLCCVLHCGGGSVFIVCWFALLIVVDGHHRVLFKEAMCDDAQYIVNRLVKCGVDFVESDVRRRHVAQYDCLVANVLEEHADILNGRLAAVVK